MPKRSTGVRPYERILAPTDLSRSSFAGVRRAAALAETFGAKLHVLHVTESIPESYLLLPGEVRDWERDRRERATERMGVLVGRMVPPGVKVRRHLREGRAWQVICDVARNIRADLIVMSTHGEKGFRHVLLGSVTERVVKCASCAVLTVRPGT